MILRTSRWPPRPRASFYDESATHAAAGRPAWADAVKDEAVAEDVVADSPSLFDFWRRFVGSEAAKALKEEMRKMTATVDAAVADARKAQQQYAQAVNTRNAPKGRGPARGARHQGHEAAKEAASQLRAARRPPPDSNVPK